MQGIVKIVDFQLHVLVIHDDRSETLLEVRVVKSVSSLLDLAEHCLPGIEIVSELLSEHLNIDIPKSLVAQPRLNVLLSLVNGIV